MARRSTGQNAASQFTGGDVLPKGYAAGQMQQFTPEQMQLFKSMFGQVGPDSYMAKLAGGDQAAFDQLEAPALRQFQGLQGDIASRFSGAGMGSRKSSGFQNTMNQASSNFAQQLQSQRMGIQQQAWKDLMGMQNELLGQRPYERFAIEQQEKKPWWRTALQAGLPIAGAAVGGAFGGVAGAKVGATAGSAAGSAFA
jgi:hypothetical protein